MTATDGFYSKGEVLEKIPWSPTTLWRQVKGGKFPPPVQLSANRVAWPRGTVDAWIELKMEAAEANAA